MLDTDRRILRPFTPRDRDSVVALNSDQRVMRYFERPCTAEDSDANLARFVTEHERSGYAFSAVERRSDGKLIGLCGLSRFQADLPFAPVTAFGWRPIPEAWGHGYATEDAHAWLRHGFDSFGLPQIVAFSPRINARSRRVMGRIGMTRDPDGDFDHPGLSGDSRLNPMALYRLGKTDWRACRAARR